MNKFSQYLVKLYQKYISLLVKSIVPFWGCRFYPTCSGYAEEAMERFGVIKGMKMTLRRLSRCHPFTEGGYDPVT